MSDSRGFWNRIQLSDLTLTGWVVVIVFVLCIVETACFLYSAFRPPLGADLLTLMIAMPLAGGLYSVFKGLNWACSKIGVPLANSRRSRGKFFKPSIEETPVSESLLKKRSEEYFRLIQRCKSLGYPWVLSSMFIGVICYDRYVGARSTTASDVVFFLANGVVAFGVPYAIFRILSARVVHANELQCPQCGVALVKPDGFTYSESGVCGRCKCTIVCVRGDGNTDATDLTSG